MRIYTLAFFLLSLAWTQAATYYVRTNGSNSNAGTSDTSGGAWLTVTYAESQMTAGDTVYVRAGTYNELPTVNISGNSSNYINFVGESGTILRGIYLTGVSYVRVIGFEFTSSGTSFGTQPIRITGTSSNVHFLDNYIHEMYVGDTGSALFISGTPTYLVIRGNTFYWPDRVGGVSNGNGNAINAPYLTANHWLVEYNTIQRTNDYINAYGQNHIIRNNALTDTQDSYFTQNWAHSDFFQPGSDGANVLCRFHVYEANFLGDNQCMGGPENAPNGHIWLLQDTVAAGDTNIIVRGNVGFRVNNGAYGVRATDKNLIYNNSFYDLNCPNTSDNPFIFYSTPSTGNIFYNNIISGIGNATDAIFVDSGSSLVGSNNIGYQAGSESLYASTSNPLYVSPATPTRNFRLQSGSPAIAAGTAVVTVASSASSGTSFTVNDGERLCDGYGIAEGDQITVGGTTTRITAISGNTVTVANSVTWTNGMAVYFGTDTTPDVGAFPYGSTALTAATISNVGTTYTVTPTGDARGVWFYVNGIPTTWDSSSPYSATIASGTVTAKAYALYAQATPVFAATAGAADTTAPTPNPMTFASNPAAVDAASATMTASTATDAGTPPVEYFFDETSGNPGGTDSGWQSSATYVDTGLSPSTLYTYRVKARDAAAALNETSYSSGSSATTSASSGGTVNIETINVQNLRVSP